MRGVSVAGMGGCFIMDGCSLSWCGRGPADAEHRNWPLWYILGLRDLLRGWKKIFYRGNSLSLSYSERSLTTHSRTRATAGRLHGGSLIDGGPASTLLCIGRPGRARSGGGDFIEFPGDAQRQRA